MKAYLVIILSFLFVMGCSDGGNYLVKTPPDKKSTAQKVADIEALTFTPQVDILFVVDDSGSMGTHQRNLSANMNRFINELAKDQILDYHIGVVSTDMSNMAKSGTLQGSPSFVDRNTSGGLGALQRNVMVGTGGSYLEESFSPVMAALTPPLVDGVNAGFYRPKAHFALVFITDAEDQSPVAVSYFLDFLERLKGGDKTKVIAYGVYVPVNDTTSCSRDSSIPPRRLEAALTELNAVTFSLCDPDYGTKLAGLGEDLSKQVGSFLPLGQAPDVDTISVTFGTQVIPKDSVRGWEYISHKMGLQFGPELELSEQPKGTELKVDFVPADDQPQ